VHKTYQSILSRIDYSLRAGMDDEDVVWRNHTVDPAVASGLLVADTPAEWVTCYDCGEYRDVMPWSESEVYLRCGECGGQPIPITRLRRWRVSLRGIWERAFDGMCNVANVETLVPDRLFRLGKAKLGTRSWTVYFGRGLHQSDAVAALSQVSFLPQSVVFVPFKTPPARLGMPPAIPLSLATTWTGSQIDWDHDYVAGQLEGVGIVAPAALPKAQRRRNRLAVVGALEKQLREHLTAAKNYALDLRQRTGIPKLLPRPTMDLLAQQLGISKSTVSRCLEDESARHLLRLWELADNLDEILRLAGAA
jgi:hypothetical protein